MRLLLTTLSLLVSLFTVAQSTATIVVGYLPSNHPANSDLFVAGSFNGWNPGDPAFKMTRRDDGTYTLNFPIADGTYQFKITRGGWDKVEVQKNGAGIENRILTVTGNTILSIGIDAWQDFFEKPVKVSTRTSSVCILDTAFLIPQLSRSRRIWIYLPADYCDGSNKKYPVLYMHDGQNVFDDATSGYGEWGIDEFMDSTAAARSIIVAIDHGNDKRLTEYNPYDNQRFGKGEGKEYVDFLVKNLKPFIDKTYRTQKGKNSTFIAGSSMGGLISMYAILKYPKVFGAAGVFSPAFWVGPAIYDEIKQKGAAVKGKIFFFAGKLEGENMVPNMLKAFEEMAAVSQAKMTTVIRDEGRHSESTWRKEFPLFYNWIMNAN